MRSFLSVALLVSLVAASPFASLDPKHIKHHNKDGLGHAKSVKHSKSVDPHHVAKTAPPAIKSTPPTKSGLPTAKSGPPTAKSGSDHSKPPTGSVVVDQSGTIPGSFKTVGAGLGALSKTSATTQTLWIKGGTYREQVYVNISGPLVIIGETADPTSYKGNKVTIINNFSQHDFANNNDLTATFRNWTPNSKVYNINMVNDFGPHTKTLGQALALSAQATNQGYYGCGIEAYQDTILSQVGTQLFAKSKIVGVVDFIFGQKAQAWFDGVDIRVFGSKGYITASGRDTADNPSIYVINKSTVDRLNSSAPDGSFFLGRPWRDFARVTFQNSQLSNVVNVTGWSQWNAITPLSPNTVFGEFGNTGPGAVMTGRTPIAKKLDKPIAIETVLGASYASAPYVDVSYLSK